MFIRIIKKLRNRNSDLKIKKDENGYFMNHSDLKIFSHDIACIKGVFRHIFNREIYNFTADSNSPLIIDAGANIGLGVLYWKRKYPKARIIAFEPSMKAYDSLIKNVQENKLTDVTCVNKALSYQEGKQLFTTNEKISGSLIVEKNLESSYEVDTTPLHKYLQQKVDLLKIDVEGAEKFLIEDIRNNIANLNNIFLEYHSFVNDPQYLSKYLQLFEENGFRYFIEDEYKKTNHFIDKSAELNQDMKLNIWAQRPSYSVKEN
ncbi:MAG: FkbM family methyltransferase [Agriterribacter sp.]